MDDYDLCRSETLKHKEEVRFLMHKLIRRIEQRSKDHDNTKLSSPEVEYFSEHTQKLSGMVYGTEEYTEQLKKLKPALDHHYANNRHHPEHFPNGISGMNLIDVIELLCDWKASCARYMDGNILKSIEINTKRFGISEDLASILRNTAELLEL